MADPFSSVEAMLRSKAAELRAASMTGLERLRTLPELIPLPKPTDGLPGTWSHGSLSLAQVTQAHIRVALEYAIVQIDKAEIAMAAGDYPRAIFWLMSAQQKERSAWAHWQASAIAKAGRYVSATRKKRAKMAILRNKEQTKYSAAQKADWADERIALEEKGHSKKRAAEIVAHRHRLAPAAVSTIRRLPITRR